MESPPHDRRSFLGWAVHGLGAIFAVILGVPIVAYIIDPRNRHGSDSAFKLAAGVRLGDLSAERPVQQGVIRDVRRDAWTLHPNDVVGRVWVVLQPNQTVPTEADERKRMSNTTSDAIRVFTTICPHLGCSVNLNANGHDFTCPCHGGTFDQGGALEHPAHNPAPRGMDTLAWKIDPSDADAHRLVVEYQSFKATLAEKVPVS